MNRKFLLFVALLVGALLFSACVVPPPAVAAPVVVGPLNEEGYPGPTTAQAKIDLGLDVQRLRTEHSAFVWRSFPNVVDVDCPSGYVCTVTLEDESIKVYQGQSGLKLRISAGTFRFIEGYSADDAVHGNPPCMLLKQEQDFGVGEVPSFVVSAGNFDCAVAQADPAMTEEPTAAPAATAAPVVTSCDNPSQWGVPPATGCGMTRASGSMVRTFRPPPLPSKCPIAGASTAMVGRSPPGRRFPLG